MINVEWSREDNFLQVPHDYLIIIIITITTWWKDCKWLCVAVSLWFWCWRRTYYIDNTILVNVLRIVLCRLLLAHVGPCSVVNLIDPPNVKLSLDFYSLSGWTSYRKISWSLEAAEFGFRLSQSLGNMTGTSAAALPRCLSNSRAIQSL